MSCFLHRKAAAGNKCFLPQMITCTDIKLIERDDILMN